MRTRLHLCHVFPTFACGGIELRAVTLINALGTQLQHSIVAVDGRFDAAARLDPALDVKLVPPPKGRGSVLYSAPMWKMLSRIAPDLLITYNWGAIDAVIAGVLGRLCPVIHCEDGFNADEAISLKRRRVLIRRLLLNRTVATVVPSRTLRDVAMQRYGVRREKLALIPNGVDTTTYSPRRVTAWRERYGISDGDIVFGSCGSLSPVKNLALLLRAFARAEVSRSWLVLVGDGRCRAELESLALKLGVAGRVVFAGASNQPSLFYSGFDVFVMSSLTEQMPIALLEAMASGLPAICSNVGDTAAILGTCESPFVVPRNDEDSLVTALRAVGRDPELRASAGAANRAKCLNSFSLDRMIESYKRLYFSAALGSESAPCVE